MKRDIGRTKEPAPLGSLREFAEWWLAERPFRPPSDAITQVAGNAGVTLYREGRYQVQLFILPPNTEITNHRHPGIDVLEVGVAGDGAFRRRGKNRDLSAALSADSEGASAAVRLRPADWHSASIGHGGGAFLSIQEWLNAPPSSVHLDWVGAPLDRNHADSLRA